MVNLRSKRNKWLLLLFFVILAALIVALLLWPRRSADGGAGEPPRQRDYLGLYLLYQGNWEFEVRSELVASLHPDLSDPLTLYAVREYDQPAYCYQGILYEPADDIYIAAPRVYEKILFSPAVSVPLEPGTVVTLPDGREWFTIQAVEYDVVREGTVTITLSPLLDAVPPPVALESGENRTVITPVANIDTGLSEWEWEPYTFQAPAALRTADGTLPPDAHLVIEQARVRAERDTLSFSALHRTIHVVE